MAASNPENVDIRILRILGLEDVFDLDYSTYATLLKEKLIEVSRGNKKSVPHDEVELLKNEFKRVRTKEGRFTPKAKKVNVGNVTNLGNMKRLPGSSALTKRKEKKEREENKKKEKQQKQDKKKPQSAAKNISDVFTSIKKSLDNINTTLKNQIKLDRKKSQLDRKTRENVRRKKQEERLESQKDKNNVLDKSKKIFSPFTNFFDALSKFLFWTILGRVVNKFLDWTEDPKNKKRFDTVIKFIKDWWPALLSAWFLFANPIGKFIRTIVGSIIKWTFALTKRGIPSLLKFIRRNPLKAGLIGTVATTAVGAYLANQPGSATIKDPSDPNKSQMDEINKGGGMFGMPLSGDMLGFSRGGNIFSGLVGKDSGINVSGAGQDTQFFPVEGGGGAVLQPGETVLQVGARERIMKERGFDPLAYNVGSNANRPRKIGSIKSIDNLFGMKGGGVVGGENSYTGIKLPRFRYKPADPYTGRRVFGSIKRPRDKGKIGKTNSNIRPNINVKLPALRGVVNAMMPKRIGQDLPSFRNVSKTMMPKGIVESNTGMDVSRGGGDTQYIPPATVKVGEAVRVFTKTSVDRGILPMLDLLESMMDPVDSKSAQKNIAGRSKIRYVPTPPVRNSRSNSKLMTLPPIQSPPMVVSAGNDTDLTNDGIPEFSAIPASSILMRSTTAQVLGIIA